MIKRLILALTILMALISPILTVRALAFDPFGSVCDSTTANSAVCKDKQVQQDAGGSNSIYGQNGIITKVVFILSIIIGIASVIVVIIGGIRYIMSGGDSGGRRHGDPSGLNSARNTILYALIGVAIALSGQALVAFVLNRL